MSAANAESNEIARREDPAEQDRIDQVIWSRIGLDPVRKIAETVGLTPEEVLRRKRELLEQVDALTYEEQIVKALYEMREIFDLTKQRFHGIEERSVAGVANSLISAQEKILKQVARLQAQNADRVTALNRLRLEELLRLVGTVVERGAQELSDTHGLDFDDVMDVFSNHLVSAAREIDAAGGG